MPSIFNIAAVAMPLLGLATAGPLLTPYSDGSCENKLDQWSYTSRNGTLYQNKSFDTGAGVSAYGNSTLKGNYESFKNLKFDVSSSSSKLGQNVYWKIDKLDEGCRVIVMQPFSQSQRGTNIPGNIILNAGSADSCYYADPAGDTVFMSFCCGTGDCSAFNVGQSVLNTKRDLPTTLVGGPSASIAGKFGEEGIKRDAVSMAGGGPSFSLASHFGQAQAQTKRGPQPKAEAVGSLAARAQAQMKRDIENVFAERAAKTCGPTDSTCYNTQWGKCKISASKIPISMPGQQQAVSNWLNCNGGGTGNCEISVAHSTTHSSEVSASQTNSDTTGSSTSSTTGSSETNTNTLETSNTDGWSLSVGASIGWGPFSVSTDATTDHSTTTDNTNTNTQVTSQEQTSSTSFSQTVANTTGHALTTAQGETLTQTFTVIPGGYAILTFLPFYDCYTVTVDCGNPWIGPLGKTKTISTQICTPTMQDGKAQGSYSLLYSNAAN